MESLGDLKILLNNPHGGSDLFLSCRASPLHSTERVGTMSHYVLDISLSRYLFTLPIALDPSQRESASDCQRRSAAGKRHQQKPCHKKPKSRIESLKEFDAASSMSKTVHSRQTLVLCCRQCACQDCESSSCGLRGQARMPFCEGRIFGSNSGSRMPRLFWSK